MIWAIGEPKKLRPATRAAIEEADNDVFVSVVSAWEAAIKRKAGKLAMPDDLSGKLDSIGLLPLEVTLEHALAAGDLPLHHADPFDRMLIAQAQLESLTIVTRYRRFASYDVALLPA